MLDEIAEMKPTVEIVITGGDALTSPLTIPVAEYANLRGIKCTLMTNATLIDENNVDKITRLFYCLNRASNGS